jgi:7-keto-8-aminopelargonate synthetase-like enzyme
VVFKHRSEEDLKAKLAKGKVAVLTDGMFALDGTVPQLGKYAKLIGKNSYLWIDDSHAAGVLGNNGGGTVDLFDLGGANVIQTTTLSKGFGVYGGVILGSGKLREKIARRSRVMIGSTPFPLPLAKGVMVSCRLLAKGRMGKKLERNVKLLERQLGWEREFPTPIFGVQNKEPGELKSALIARDVFPSFIRYPGGPEEGYFRFAVSSLHNQEQLIRLAEALKAAGQGEA